MTTDPETMRQREAEIDTLRRQNAELREMVRTVQSTVRAHASRMGFLGQSLLEEHYEKWLKRAEEIIRASDK